MSTASDPTFEARPWGSFTVLDDQATHKVKSLTVNPGHRVSYQQHARRSEHWFVVAGTATVTLDGRKLTREGVDPDIDVLLEDLRLRGDRQHPFWAVVDWPLK